MTREKHLELIQGVINRMASNSFQLKGWSVVLVSALFALAAQNAKVYFVPLAFFPALAFWLLDGYFLRQKRLYRKLYDAVRKVSDEKSDFSMDTSAFRNEVPSWPKTCISRTLFIFHGIIVAVVFLVMLIAIMAFILTRLIQSCPD